MKFQMDDLVVVTKTEPFEEGDYLGMTGRIVEVDPGDPWPYGIAADEHPNDCFWFAEDELSAWQPAEPTEPCSTCDGKGGSEYTVRTDGGEVLSSFSMKCKRCEGTGKVSIDG